MTVSITKNWINPKLICKTITNLNRNTNFLWLPAQLRLGILLNRMLKGHSKGHNLCFHLRENINHKTPWRSTATNFHKINYKCAVCVTTKSPRRCLNRRVQANHRQIFWHCHQLITAETLFPFSVKVSKSNLMRALHFDFLLTHQLSPLVWRVKELERGIGQWRVNFYQAKVSGVQVMQLFWCFLFCASSIFFQTNGFYSIERKETLGRRR